MQRTDNPFHLYLLYRSTELRSYLINRLTTVVSDFMVELHHPPVESLELNELPRFSRNPPGRAANPELLFMVKSFPIAPVAEDRNQLVVEANIFDKDPEAYK